MSAIGPKQTSATAPHMSAFGGKADIRGDFPQDTNHVVFERVGALDSNRRHAVSLVVTKFFKSFFLFLNLYYLRYVAMDAL